MAGIGQNAGARSTRWLFVVVAILVGAPACSAPIPGCRPAPPQHTTSLPQGGDMYQLLSALQSTLGRLDEVLDQTSRRCAALAEDPTLYDDRRDPAATTARRPRRRPSRPGPAARRAHPRPHRHQPPGARMTEPHIWT
jgi:hypothetical protein